MYVQVGRGTSDKFLLSINSIWWVTASLSAVNWIIWFILSAWLTTVFDWATGKVEKSCSFIFCTSKQSHFLQKTSSYHAWLPKMSYFTFIFRLLFLVLEPLDVAQSNTRTRVSRLNVNISNMSDIVDYLTQHHANMQRCLSEFSASGINNFRYPCTLIHTCLSLPPCTHPAQTEWENDPCFLFSTTMSHRWIPGVKYSIARNV